VHYTVRFACFLVRTSVYSSSVCTFHVALCTVGCTCLLISCLILEIYLFYYDDVATYECAYVIVVGSSNLVCPTCFLGGLLWRLFDLFLLTIVINCIKEIVKINKVD
jgi:hypothetical protein